LNERLQQTADPRPRRSQRRNESRR
jgi:hypothetical protein